MNRDQIRAYLTATLERDQGAAPTVVVLTGLPGTGKTALALRLIADWAAILPEGHLCVDLHQPGMTTSIALGSCLRAVGWPAHRVPDTEHERAALWRSVSAPLALGVVLDSPASTHQARTLLPAGPRSVTLITSRHQLPGLLPDGAHLLTLTALDRDSARALLRAYLDPTRLAGAQDPIEDLITLCGRLPLPLTLAAAHLASRPHRHLPTFVDRLRTTTHRPDAPTIEGASSLSAILDQTYATLPADAAAAYRALGLAPAGIASNELLAAALATTPDRTDDLATHLLNVHLIREEAGGRYRIDELVQGHARDKARSVDGTEMHPAWERIALWYLYSARRGVRAVMPTRPLPAFDQPEPGWYHGPEGIDQDGAASAWFHVHRPAHLEVVRDAPAHDCRRIAILLAHAVLPEAIKHGDSEFQNMIDQLALAAADTPGPEFEHARHRIRHRWARRLAWAHDIPAAQRLYDDDAAADPTPTLRRQATRFKTLATIHRAAGRPDDAIEALRHCDTLHAQPGVARPRTRALALIELADLLVETGSPAEALVHTRHAQRLLQTLTPADHYNTARSWLTEATIIYTLGDLPAATTIATDTLDVMLAEDSAQHAAHAHHLLARIADAQADPDRAAHHRHEAAELTGAPTVSHPYSTPD